MNMNMKYFMQKVFIVVIILNNPLEKSQKGL